ncbi:cytochrome-c oxidase [Thalassospira lucentensis]|uniref:cytochrome-c oxidase n=1 Tax=Thalassospira lucentensis TaxID=168935 RepID=UPI0011BF4452|nr:cytochrome-c oxidase [Thalassospira lucentensis]
MLLLILTLIASPAFAHHPGERLDEVMAEKEPHFEVTDIASVPEIELLDKTGERFVLGELDDQILILSFVTDNCGAACAEQQILLAAIQEQLNISPMRDMVMFVTVHSEGFSGASSWDSLNWRPTTPSSDISAAIVADDFARLSQRNGSAPMVHMIDRNTRHAGIFHGTGFKQINLILYVNGLTNAVHSPKPPVKKGWLDRLTDWFSKAGKEP